MLVVALLVVWVVLPQTLLLSEAAGLAQSHATTTRLQHLFWPFGGPTPLVHRLVAAHKVPL